MTGKELQAKTTADIARQAATTKAAKQSFQEVQRGDRRIRETLDASGRVIATEDLGAAKEDFKPNLFETPSGIIEVPVGGDIPADATPLTTRTLDLTENQRAKLNQDLAKIEGWITDPEADPRGLMGYINYFNKNAAPDNPYTYEVFPEIPGSAFLGITNPLTGTDERVIRMPKDSKTGLPITYTDIKAKADETGATVEEVLEFLGVIQ